MPVKLCPKCKQDFVYHATTDICPECKAGRKFIERRPKEGVEKMPKLYIPPSYGRKPNR